MKIVLGVCGGIAAYKAVFLLRLFTEAGHDVTVIPTEHSLRFVGKATWEALSGHKVATSLFDDASSVHHVTLAQEADIIVVAPATANFIAKIRAGFADDLLSSTLLMATCPLLLAPAMHTEMWLNLATEENLRVLQARGIHVINPVKGRLTGKDTGIGRLVDPEIIFSHTLSVVSKTRELLGKKIVITAGGTKEPIDPVRYLGNRSSGKQGIELAHAAWNKAAEVIFIHTLDIPTLNVPVHSVPVETAENMHQAVKEHMKNADILIMNAAVADYTAVHPQNVKIKKSTQETFLLEFKKTKDILANFAHSSKTIIGFAAETGDQKYSINEYAQQKLHHKGCDALVVNDVSEGKIFGADHNKITILFKDQSEPLNFQGTKREVAEVILEHIVNIENKKPTRLDC